ncbi:3'-5' exonuclease [Bradyrhizobium sp. DN5]|uniref:3'-5' exonuclease n=1 Tax=Bradyrhizobium sp. DN5 TaxID=3056950 RepID=UPI0035253EBD
MAISYFTTKDFDRSLSAAIQAGGRSQKIANKVKAILGGIAYGDPFSGIPVTNNGESRIPSCVKYWLDDSWRLVTQQTNNTCFFLFVGDHEDADRWLNGHKGQLFGIKDGRTILVPGVGRDARHISQHKADHQYQPLAERLGTDEMDYVLDGLSRSVARKLEALDGQSTPQQLISIVALIEDPKKRDLVQAVFALLLEGNYDGAQAHIDLSIGRIKSFEDWDPLESIEVLDGEDVRRIRIGSAEYEDWLRTFEKQSAWYEWFLYLHPEQEKVVNKDYPGVAQLSGVSGSGKTCVCVRRALRLARSSGSNVLVLTLNRSLAGLLNLLIDAACADDEVRSRIQVSSFFELAQKLLASFEPLNQKLYADVTWKLGEHVDEVFREYYRCWTNNNDADALLAVHKTITARGVSAETYVREEFDWIRSAVQPHSRQAFLTMERKGRKFPIAEERRQDVLLGLVGWERKMRDVGVIDYLGLTSALSNHLAEIVPQYSSILVDEAQDFGTTELGIVRRLVPPGENDIFLCGDIAQTILPKHRLLSEAGVSLVARERIRQNYRNSREILRAAYDVLKNNLHDEIIGDEDLEILDPKFANFSGPIPMALAANTLEEEIAYAYKYAETRVGDAAKSACVAFAGFSARDIAMFAEKYGVDSLDGTYSPAVAPIVFCDLEQTKGYEFDTLIIVQCSEGVLPPRDAPKEEEFRTSCKLYVAMTRAKKELILSFHGALSAWIKAVSTTIGTGFWEEVEILEPGLMRGIPDRLPECEPIREVEDLRALTGREFIYTSQAVGLSSDAQDKLIELVDGRGLRSAGTGGRLKWPDMKSLLDDLHSGRRSDRVVGPSIAEELRGIARTIETNTFIPV